MHTEPPPKPPPMPAPPSKQPSQTSVKMRSKVSPFIRKLQAAPKWYGFEPRNHPEAVDPLSPPCGPYFFYGTLMDPSLLAEILSLSEKPELCPAKLVGYTLKLWGQYPALVDGAPGQVVEGVVYHVRKKEHAERLAEYETRTYWPTPCRIQLSNPDKSQEIGGSTFKYVGNPMDINDGAFDLQVWLRRLGRAESNERSV